MKEILTREGVGTTLVTALLGYGLVGHNMYTAGSLLSQGYWEGWIIFGLGILVGIVMTFALVVNRDTAYLIGRRHVHEERIDRDLARGLAAMQDGRDFGFTRRT